MRRKNSRFRWNGKLGAEQKRLLPVAVVPLTVLILIAVIMFADWKKNDGQTEPEVGLEQRMEDAQSDAQHGEEAGNEAGDKTGENETFTGETDSEADGETDGETETQSVSGLWQDSNPEILSLMKQYFKARASADAETMNSLYGIGEVGAAALEAQKSRMRSNSKYVQGFEHVTTYVKDGMTADSWLVYAVSDIRFHAVKTAAPMIMWCYVIKDADGSYRISDPATLSPEVLQYIDVESRSEDVRRLASSVNVALKEALTSDEDLREVYGVLREGSPVWKNEEEDAAVQILDLEPEDICTDDFSGESTVLDDGTAQLQQEAPELNVNEN